MGHVKNAKPEWMRTSPKEKAIEKGELTIDREINDKDMYIFRVNGKRLRGIFKKKFLEDYWRDLGSPEMNVQVELKWRDGNSRLVERYII